MPRYRQKVRHVPGDLARPVWVDDADFDVAYHVRRSALPNPGSDAQFTGARRPADVAPARPQPPAVGDVPGGGLAGGRSAVLTKTHQAMVDGVTR